MPVTVGILVTRYSNVLADDNQHFALAAYGMCDLIITDGMRWTEFRQLTTTENEIVRHSTEQHSPLVINLSWNSARNRDKCLALASRRTSVCYPPTSMLLHAGKKKLSASFQNVCH